MLYREFKSRFVLVAVVLFVVFILVAHENAPQQYQWKQNTISDLGAQYTKNNAIMRVGFVLFGFIVSLGIIINGLKWRTVCLLVYAISVALTGFFSTKPYYGNATYSILEHELHGVFAQIAGITFSLQIMIEILLSTLVKMKLLHTIFLILVIVTSLSFGLFDTYTGIIQRILYLISFLWLLFIFNHSKGANKNFEA